MKRALLGSALLLFLLAPFSFLSHATLVLPAGDASQLIFAFRNVSKAGTRCRNATPEELARMLPHMRTKQICESRRSSTRVRVALDGAAVFDETYRPLGWRSEGVSMGMTTLPVPPGTHQLDVNLETGEAAEAASFARSVSFSENHAYLLEYQSGQGFRMHEEDSP